jgi:hypothetical protein
MLQGRSGVGRKPQPSEHQRLENSEQRLSSMEIFRHSRDVWGQETLLGISWDLLPVFFWAGVAFIAGHAIYSWLTAPKRS